MNQSLLSRVIISLVLSALGCNDNTSTSRTTELSGAFSMLTYNVAGLPQGLSGSNPETNIPLISPLLNEYSIVLLQEDFWYPTELSIKAEHPHKTTPKEATTATMGDGLNQYSHVAIENFERVQWVACHGELTNSSDCLAEKGFTFSTMTLAPGLEIHVYNHHAEAGGDPEDVAARRAGFEQLSAFVTTRSANHAVVIAGDTNLHGMDPDDEPMLQAFMNSTDTRDVCRTLGCPVESIDRILFRSTERIILTPTRWSQPPEFMDDEGVDLSDHRPVAVQWAWTAQARDQ